MYSHEAVSTRMAEKIMRVVDEDFLEQILFVVMI